MNGKITLAGGGDAPDSRLLDQKFAHWLGPQGKLLYLPLAMRGHRPYADCFEWIQATFAPFQIDKITMWADLTEHEGRELAAFDGVYIGGGNTYSLLAQFLESGFDQHLIQFVQSGGAVYGGSAGAILLSKNLQTIAHRPLTDVHRDPNELHLAETRCLNLAADHVVWVHYNEQDDPLIVTFGQKFGDPVLAIPERSGIVIEQNTLRAVGYEAVYQFNEQGKHAIAFADSILSTE